MAETVVFPLTDQGRLVDPKALAAFFIENDGKPIQIDAEGAPMFTSLHLQVYISALGKWTENSWPIELVNANDQFNNCLALLGRPLDTLNS